MATYILLTGILGIVPYWLDQLKSTTTLDTIIEL